MRRRKVLAVALATAVVVLLAGVGYLVARAAGEPPDRAGGPGSRPSGSGGAAVPGPARPADRPNIVFVLTDDLSSDLLPYMPHVQELQRRGTTFSNYFVTNSLCCPSRATILTGGHPHTTGVLTNGGSDGGYPEFRHRGDGLQTYATSLRSAGYTTAMMGKYLNGYRTTSGGTPRASVEPGWSEWYVPGDHDGYAGYDYTLNENGTLVRYGHAPGDYLTDVLSAKGTDFIRRTAGTGAPFLLQVSTFSPHAPYTPAPRHADAYPGLTHPRTPAFNRPDAVREPAWLAGRPPLSAAQTATVDQIFRKRAQAVRSVDDLVGALVETLRAQGLLESTYLFFSSDNGYHLGEHRLGAGKMTAFDTDINVPLIVGGPGVPAGRTSDALVANIDLCPTFQEIGRGAPTPLVDGRSLLPLLQGRTPPDWRDAVLVEHTRPGTAAQAGPDRERTGGDPPSYAALRLRDALYVEYADRTAEYYDLSTDPHQVRSHAGALPAARRAALHRKLAALTACRGPASCSTVPTLPAGQRPAPAG